MLCRKCIREAASRQLSTLRMLSGRAYTTSASRPAVPPTSFAEARSARSLQPRSLSSLLQPVPWCSPRPYSTATSTEVSPATEPPNAIEKPDFLDDAESKIWDILVAEFDPKELIVRDVSGGCGSMYRIEISSDRFRRLKTLQQHRLVYGVLADLIESWHGAQLKTCVP